MTRFVSNKTVVHSDLICLSTYFSLNFDQFAWSLRPYLPDHLFPVTFRPICVMTYSSTKKNYKFRPICLITSTLFAWSLIPRYYIPINFDQFDWSLRPYLSDHLFLVTFRLICVMTCSNTKLCLLQPNHVCLINCI